LSNRDFHAANISFARLALPSAVAEFIQHHPPPYRNIHERHHND
jgi:hypothetical protein